VDELEDDPDVDECQDYLHPVACIVCGATEQHWVDVFICDRCHKSGRAAVEFETLKRLNELLKDNERRRDAK
jgi:hypothetical protein